MKSDRFLPGIDTLLGKHRRWLSGRRIGLLSHPAALDSQGCHSSIRLHDAGVRLTALFGPEHGFFGAAGSGEPVRRRKHPVLDVPVYSLYGKQRRPTPSMLRNIDTLLVDLQDIGVRCYTYLSTLRFVMEEAYTAGKEVIVADRPIPLPETVDGPVTAAGHESFVAALPVPMVYGMTPGESARWIRDNICPNVDLKVAEMTNYCRDHSRGPGWPPWVPPSPGIASLESARCYPATVFSEAFPQIDHGARSGLPFQVIGATWLDGPAVCDHLCKLRLPGVLFHPHTYMLRGDGPLVRGIRLVVSDPAVFRPVLTSVALLSALRHVCGIQRIWRNRKTRCAFMDKLFGTSRVREKLLENETHLAISTEWRPQFNEFRSTRDAALLYPRTERG